MKVVEGEFGKDKSEAGETPLQEIINQILDDTEMGKVTGGSFMLLVDTDDRMTFATNEDSKPVLVYMLETAKNLLINGAD
jgi:hypothetical protein